MDTGAAEASKTYQPLVSVSVPGMMIDPKGLMLIVGPNSSGKTQFLRDIQTVLSGQSRTFVVCAGLSLAKPRDLMAYLRDMEASGCLRRVQPPNANEGY